MRASPFYDGRCNATNHGERHLFIGQYRRCHRLRRERRSQAGMLIQIDGSKHRWLGSERPFLTLLAGIDDATGLVVAACFREEEDTAGYLQLLDQLVEQVGRPEALYHDRHSIVVRAAHEPDTLAEQLAGTRNSNVDFDELGGGRSQNGR